MSKKHTANRKARKLRTVADHTTPPLNTVLHLVFEYFTTAELIFARVVIFVLFLVGLWAVIQWGLHK